MPYEITSLSYNLFALFLHVQEGVLQDCRYFVSTIQWHYLLLINKIKVLSSVTFLCESILCKYIPCFWTSKE